MNFGEILEPSSRAFWDDFDDELEGPDFHSKFLANVEWIWLTENNILPINIKIQLLVVIEGTGIRDFIKSTILKDLRPIGISKNANIHAYYLLELKQMILFSEENDLNFSGKLTEFIQPFIEKAEHVITFSLQSKVQYKGDDLESVQNEITFLRGINSKLHYIKELNAPNFITGISAGVASLRYIKKLSITSYIGYTDPGSDLDGISVQPILKLFQDIGIKCDKKYISKYKDPSHLYM